MKGIVTAANLDEALQLADRTRATTKYSLLVALSCTVTLCRGRPVVLHAVRADVPAIRISRMLIGSMAAYRISEPTMRPISHGKIYDFPFHFEVY